MVGGVRPFLSEISAETDPALQNAEFSSIFARNASSITLSEKKFNYD